MTQALNYTPKAIEHLRTGVEKRFAPEDARAGAYILRKLTEAQVFVLPMDGRLFDAGKAAPPMKGSLLRPPFPVVALEYPASWLPTASGQVKSTRRIALAWDWRDDLPAVLKPYAPSGVAEGVAILSAAYFDDLDTWSCPAVATLLPYDQDIEPAGEGVAVTSHTFGLMPSAMADIHRRGEVAGREVLEALKSDLCEEVAAYVGLCSALACRNIMTTETPAPAGLNRQRQKAGKQPLKGFHVLKLRGRDGLAAGSIFGDRAGPRSHLRRGHIRRLGPDRMTWVSHAVVRGRGFVDKVYAL